MPDPAHDAPIRLRDSETLRRLFWPAVWLTLFLMLFATWRLYWKVQLQNEIAKVRDAGYPASPAEVEAWYKKPVGDNAADYWIKAHTEWKDDQTLEDWLPSLTTVDLDKGVNAYGLNTYGPVEGVQYPDEVFDQAREYFTRNAASFRWMDKAAQTEGCRWPGDFSKGMAMLIPYLGEQKKMANRLGERLRLAGRDGDWPACAALLDTGFKLGRDLGEGPNWIHGLVGASVDALMLRGLEGRVLPFVTCSGAQLEALTGRLADERGLCAAWIQRNYQGETAILLEEGMLEKVALAPGFSLFGSSVPSYPKPVVWGWAVLGGADHDLAKIASFRARSQAILQLSEAARWDAICKLDQAWERSLRSWEIGCKKSYFLDRAVFAQHLRALALFDAALTALAAERHRRDTGRLPATLKELVPQYLPAVPADLFDAGKPLKYKIEADRFAVYSLGKDGKDDGGEDHTDAKPNADDIGFTILLPNAKRGVAQKRKPVEAAE